MYIIRKGCVAVVGKRMHLMGLLTQGDYFGEIAMFTMVRPASRLSPSLASPLLTCAATLTLTRAGATRSLAYCPRCCAGQADGHVRGAVQL